MMFPYGSRRLADPPDPGPRGQAQDQAAEHLEGGAARADDHRGPQLTSDLASVPTAPERDRDVALDWGL